MDAEELNDLPEIELIDGLEFPKMSPRRRHSLLQGALCAMLRAWAAGRGSVGTEWRFRVSGEPGRENSYVPDVAFVWHERLDALSEDDAEEPPFAPDLAVEVRSPGDRDRTVRRKIERYVQYGAKLVLDVRPDSRTIVAVDPYGEKTFGEADVFEHAAFAGFRFEVASLFAEADARPRS